MTDFRETEETPYVIDANEGNQLANQKLLKQNEDTDDELEADSREELDKDTMEKFDNLWQHARAYRAGYYDSLWEVVERSYLGYKDYRAGAYNPEKATNKEKFRSNLRVWNTYIQVESSVADLVPSILNDPDSLIYVEPSTYTQNGNDKANAVKQLLKYQFLQQMDATSLLIALLKTGETKGLSCLKLSYKYETASKLKRRPIMDPITGNCRGFVRMRRNEILHDRPDVSVPQMENIWWNMDATDQDDSVRWVIERQYYTRDEIKKLGEAGIFRNTEELLDKVSHSVMDSTTKLLRLGQMDFSSSEDPLIEIYEMWTPTRLITGSLETMICLRDTDNPFDDQIIPYFFYRATPVAGEMVGIGQVEPILDLDDESNAKRNQRIDNINRQLNQQFLSGSASGIRVKSLQFVPFNVIQGNDISQFKALEFPDVTQNAMIEDERAKVDMDKTNGNFDIGRGEQPQKTASATEIATRVSQMSARKELKVKLLHRTLGKVWKAMWGLNQQFACTSAIVRVSGPDGSKLKVDPMAIYAGEYDFEFGSGGYIGNKLYDLQQLTQFLQQILPTPMGQVLDMRKLWGLVSKRWNIPGIEDCVNHQVIPPHIEKDPTEENIQMLLGQQVEVLDGELHEEHIPIHIRDLLGPGVSDETRRIGTQHINNHYGKMQAVAQAQAAAQPQIPAGQPGMPPRLGGNGPGINGAVQDLSNSVTVGGANAPNIMA